MKKFIAKVLDLLNGIGKDKYQHFALGALIAFCVFGVVLVILGDSKAAFWISFGISVIATTWSEVYKECYLDDEGNWWDVVATLFGGVLVWGSLIVGYLQ